MILGRIDQLFLFENSEISIFGRFGREIFSSIGYSIHGMEKIKMGQMYQKVYIFM